jgi:hypothetical protein
MSETGHSRRFDRTTAAFAVGTRVTDGGAKPRKGARCEFYLGDARGGGKQAVRVFVFEAGSVEE